MSLSFVSANDVAASGLCTATVTAAATLPVVYFDDAANPLHADPLMTVSLTALPNEAAAAAPPREFTSSERDSHVDAAANCCDAASVALTIAGKGTHSLTPPLNPLSGVECSSDARGFPGSSSPLLSPVAPHTVAASAACTKPMDGPSSCSHRTSSVTEDESFNWGAADPSLSFAPEEPQQSHSRQVLTAAATTSANPLDNFLSSAVAVTPSSAKQRKFPVVSAAVADQSGGDEMHYLAAPANEVPSITATSACGMTQETPTPTFSFKAPPFPPQDALLRRPAASSSQETACSDATTTTTDTSTPTTATSPPAAAGSSAATKTPSSAAVTPHTASLPVCLPSPPQSSTKSASASLSSSLVSSSASCTSTSAPRVGCLKPPARLMSWIRSRVSQNKVRFRDGNFNLDLTYITPHIIAMGYPAHGTEYYIRNPIDEVERFFDERHPRHFRIYNLCSERAYDNTHRFHGCFRSFPFDDHNVPPLGLILQFVLDAATFLDADENNVVAVHCKAGKGRTGIMVSCLLFYLYPDKFTTAKDAIHFFDQQRTCDGEGMTIPSQRRYVNYFERVVREFHGALPVVQRKLVVKEVVIRVARENTILLPGDLYFIISDHQHMLLDSRMWFPRGPTISTTGCVFSFASLNEGSVPPVLVGDLKVAVFRRRPIVLSGKESMSCYLWFNTTLCPSLQMVYQRTELDKVDVAAVGKSVMVSLSFAQAVEAEGETAAPTQGPQKKPTI
jgi:hypothetical protein